MNILVLIEECFRLVDEVENKYGCDMNGLDRDKLVIVEKYLEVVKIKLESERNIEI